MGLYKARIEPNNENIAGVVADFYITNSDTNEDISLWVFNGDYEDKEELYICPSDPNSEYDDLMVVYMYDVIADEKFHELQNNIFYHAEFETMKLDSPDVQIDLKEYFRDEEKKDIKSNDYEMEI